MVEYSLNLCYGIVVSVDKFSEIVNNLTDTEYDEMIDNYAHCINGWTGEPYFIGLTTRVLNNDDNIYYVSDFSAPSDDSEDLINFKKFFDKHNLWRLIDWKPQLLLINFCF